ncbi:hypothetical protein GCM10009730_67660 [Streptomyces albidochromogenes]|uniref:hypothetical protein n=1 Tax=Streptomyces albidochromogenes TaxID=329524 RepID=UPI00110FB075|nr:hypothetical protein [Streptomyces albidochromogenes]
MTVATTAMLARDGEGIVDTDRAWTEQIRLEYAAAVMILLPERMDQHVVQLSSPGGSRCWTMVDRDVANGQDKLWGLTKGTQRPRCPGGHGSVCAER